MSSPHSAPSKVAGTSLDGHRLLFVGIPRQTANDVRSALQGAHYAVLEVESSDQALAEARRWSPDVVLAHWTEADPHAFVRLGEMQSWSPVERPVLVGYASDSEVSRDKLPTCCDDLIVGERHPLDLAIRLNVHLRLREAQLGVHFANEQLMRKAAELDVVAGDFARELMRTQDVAVFTLAKVAESRDNETGEHLHRMRAYSQLLAQELSREPDFRDEITSRFLDNLYRSSPLHDIGKVGIPDNILLKPGKLTVAEFEVMKRHTVIGANILDGATQQSSSGCFLAMGALIARFHHEKWDGSGYPAGLVGEEIPLSARIISVADVFDALTSKRPYKEAFSVDEATRIIDEGSGGHFDPRIVRAFHRVLPEFIEVKRRYADRPQVVTGAMAFAEYGRCETNSIL